MIKDNEAIYDNEIQPLMAKILEICKQHQIPMLASFQLGPELDDGTTLMCTSRLPFDGENENLANATKELFKKPRIMAFTISTESKQC